MANRNKSIKNFPNLRFPGFEGEWETKKLGEVATFSKGKGISKNDIDENGFNECIRYGELYTHYGEVISEIKSKTNVNISSLVLSEANDVIIPSSGETKIDIATASCVLKSGVVLGGDLNIIKTSLNGVFLSYYLNNKKKFKIAMMAQGISVVHLYSSHLASLTLSLPIREEQDEISGFLIKLDKRIHTQSKTIEQLETLMKGLTQKIFNQEIRFKNDDGSAFPDWEDRKVEDIFQVTRGNVLAVSKMKQEKDENFIYPVYSSQTMNNGITGFYNEFLYENAITWTTDGANAGEVKFRKGKFYCTNVCGVLINNEGYANICNAKILNSITKRYVSYVGNPKLMNKVMAKIKFSFPSVPEQQKISSFLSLINQKIEKERQILMQYQYQKKYFLQNLFV